MKVELRFFASVRESLGVANETVSVPDTVVNVGDVRAWLRMACDHVMTDASKRITEGCEVAFFPPVTGG